jgi:hypothetical protein
MPRVTLIPGASDPFAEARRASLVLCVPVLAGAVSPWVLWMTAGGVGASSLALASLAMAFAYLQAVWWLGNREVELRRLTGRRYRPPSADLTLAVCAGLAVSLIAPGLSAYALVDVVGLPRAAGLVAEYDPQALGVVGATIDLSPVMPGPVSLKVIPGGIARVVVPRFGNPTVFAVPWQATSAEFCIAPRQCLAVNRASGRVSVGDDVVGRVTSIGFVLAPDNADQWGAPWEIVNLFR